MTGDRQRRRAFFVPEVLQASLLDCGPAALKAVLDGFGIRVAYDELRERCQTDVDGTSIEAIARLGAELGLRAREIAVPHDAFLLPEARCLPAIVLQRTATGELHFVVVWRTFAGRVQVLDPEAGRRWLPIATFTEQMPYVTTPITVARWRAWMASWAATSSLVARMAAFGIDRRVGRAFVDLANGEPDWHAAATLDASVRMVGRLVQAKAVPRGRAAERLLRDVFVRAGDDRRNAFQIVPRGFWWTTAGAARDKVLVHGAVVVCFAPRAAPEKEATAPEVTSAYRDVAAPEPIAPPATARPRPDEEGEGVARRILRASAGSTWLLALLVALVAPLSAFDAIVMRGLLDAPIYVALAHQRVVGALVVAGLVVLSLGLEHVLAIATARLGARLETRIRVALLTKLPRLSDHYIRGRPTADMTSRAHAMHMLRDAPAVLVRAARGALTLAVLTACIAWLSPAARWATTLATAAMVLVPYAFRRGMLESSMKLRTHAAALDRYYLDALVGAVPIRAHGAETTIRRQHEALLAEWARCSETFHRQTTTLVGVQGLVAMGAAAAIVAAYVLGGGLVSRLLVLAYWATRMPVSAHELVTSLVSWRGITNVAVRLFSPLGAPEIDGEGSATPPRGAGGGASIALRDVSVVAGGRAVLARVSLRIAPGEHVAIVGKSGAGKSSLCALLMGLLPVQAGSVEIDGVPLDAAALARFRARVAWIDPTVRLWNESLFENVRFGAEHTSVDARAAAMTSADLVDVIETLPEGIQTSLGEGGGRLSGGQGQRVRLARALARTDARLAILDEPFRGLERERRRALLTRARATFRATTLLFVSHDVRDALHLDRVLVVDEGRVVEDGPPRDLAARPGSAFAALLDADHRATDAVWSARRWLRREMRDGRLDEPAEAR